MVNATSGSLGEQMRKPGAPRTVMRLTRNALFRSQPFAVRSATITRTTAPTACEGLKLIYIVRGSSTITHESGQFDLSAGSLALLPAEHWYIGAPRRAVETLTLYLDTDYIRDQIRWLPSAAPFLEQALSFSSPTLLRQHPLHRAELPRFLQSMANAPKASADAALIQLAQLGTLLTSLEQLATGFSRDKEPRRALVDTAVQLLCENLQRSWSIADLAQAVALSPSQLTRLFIQHLGTSPAKFLREARARQMYELLLTTDLNVNEASCEVGWPDPSQGARAFRSIFGFSPQQSRVHRQVTIAPSMPADPLPNPSLE